MTYRSDGSDSARFGFRVVECQESDFRKGIVVGVKISFQTEKAEQVIHSAFELLQLSLRR